jgi:hypothetical protein
MQEQQRIRTLAHKMEVAAIAELELPDQALLSGDSQAERL